MRFRSGKSSGSSVSPGTASGTGGGGPTRRRGPDPAPGAAILADRRVDNARLRGLLDVRRLRFVTPDELLTLTGRVPGAVPPFGHLFGLEVLVDEELTRCEEIAFNAGSRAVSITMRCADFVRPARARVCRFAQG